MHDRAMQTLYKMALEPMDETLADPNSYGFRPRRSCNDAIAQCFLSLCRDMSARWVFEADIKGCFDNIRHDWILKNIPINKTILKKWMKSGYIVQRQTQETVQRKPWDTCTCFNPYFEPSHQRLGELSQRHLF
jgi:RNA-directed DNA polymerase